MERINKIVSTHSNESKSKMPNSKQTLSSTSPIPTLVDASKYMKVAKDFVKDNWKVMVLVTAGIAVLSFGISTWLSRDRQSRSQLH